MQIDAGLSVGQVALLNAFVDSLVIATFGSLGGPLVARLGVRNALLLTLGGTAFAAALLSALLFAQARPSVGVAVAVAVLVFGASTVVTVGVHSWFMGLCAPDTAATDFSLLTSAEALFGIAVAAVGGLVAEQFGYGLLMAGVERAEAAA